MACASTGLNVNTMQSHQSCVDEFYCKIEHLRKRKRFNEDSSVTTSESSSAFEVESSSVLASISRRYLDSVNKRTAGPGLSSPLDNSEPQQATLKL